VASTFTNLLFHLVFQHQGSRPSTLYSYIGGIVRDEGGALLAAGGMPDHVHLLACFKADMSVSEMVRRIKANSSKWIPPGGRSPALRPGRSAYGAFSVSESQKAR